MILPILRAPPWLRHRLPKGVPGDLPPRLMRDIGFDCWPDIPRPPYHLLW